MTGWYAHISRPSQEVILHLMDLQTHGQDYPKLTNPGEVRAFLANHPEIEAVNVYSSDFPRRPVPIGKFGDKLIKKLFKYQTTA